MEKPKPCLEMRSITKRFGSTCALAGVDLSVAPGEVHALVGENGAGKTTLMKILSGVYGPERGEMFLDGDIYRPASPLDARRRGIGMIYQELSVIPHLSVEENLLLGTEPTAFGFIKKNKMRETALRVIQQLGHPEIKPEQLVGRLSVSARQIVEIGRSLAVGCRILVFDEPTSSLSQRDTERLFLIISELKLKDIAIIYISHFLEEVKRIADHITVLRDGSVVKSQGAKNIGPQEIIRQMVGREVQELYPKNERISGEPLLTVKHLAGKPQPLRVDFTLHRSEVLGIFGLVGSGRTELLRILFGLDPIVKGQVRLGVWSATRETPPTPTRRWRQGMGLLSENRLEEGIIPDFKVSENITLVRWQNLGPLGFLSPNKQKLAAQQWINDLDIRCQDPDQAILELSGGNQQKVALARLLECDVDVFLLDEPTKGIDVAAKAKIYQKINQVSSPAGDRAKAVLIVSSYIPELLGICDRIAVMSEGILGQTLPVSQWDEHSLMREALPKGGQA